VSWSGEANIEELPITKNLLDVLNEDQLQVLVQEALNNNPNLNATAHRLRAATFLLGDSLSRLLPQVNGEYSDGRNNQGVDAATGKNRVTHSHRISLGISWEIDLWGRLAEEYNGSKQDVLAKEQEYLLARDALAARVIQSWINTIGLKRSVAIEQERLAVLEHIRNVLTKRYKNGLGNLDEISTAAGRAEIAKADVSGQQTAFLREKRAMELLLGRYPQGNFSLQDRLPEVLPPPVHPPAVVLLHRPDTLAALARVESARLLADSAEKARLPQINLSGQLFRDTSHLSNLGSATSYWNMLGSLLQPIFDGGRLKAAAQASQSEFLASVMDLRATVLRAMQEVENGFALERDFKAQVHALKIAVRESEQSSHYYIQRYRQGLDTIQNLLIAREQEMAVKSRLNQVVTDRLSNRIDLALALGVGLGDDHTAIQEL
jgi:NodT family efflux transporter outer membrane factor (OMF) lipoprotein